MSDAMVLRSRASVIGWSEPAFLHLLLLTVGSMFLSVGVGASVPSLWILSRHQQAEDWPEVQARILSVDLKCDTGTDCATYKVVCRYEYEWHGRSYAGEHVGLSGGSDNLGFWQHDTHARLAAAHEAGQSVPCYVNPSRPEEALLVRELRYEWLLFVTLFSVVFGSMGSGMIISGAGMWRQRRRRRGLAAAHPDEPWLHNPQWAEGVIRLDGLGLRTVIAWTVAIYWSVVSLPLLVVLPPAMSGPNALMAAMGLLYPLVGAAILVYALYLTWVGRRLGATCVELDTLPGVVGGRFRGRLVSEGEVADVHTVEMLLTCWRLTKSEESVHADSVYEDGCVISGLRSSFGQTRLSVPFDFQIPAFCPPTSNEASTRVCWQLTACLRRSKAGRPLRFDVPVFVTAETDPTVGKPPAMLAAEEAVILAETSPVPDTIRVTQLDATTRQFEVCCRPGPRGLALLGVVLLIFAAAAAFIARELLSGNWLALIGLAFFVLIVLVAATIGAMVFARYTLTVSPQGASIRRSWAWIGYRRSVPVDRVASLKYIQSASCGSRKWYAVHACLPDGGKLTLADMIPSELAARWFLRQIHLGLGRPDGEEVSREVGLQASGP